MRQSSNMRLVHHRLLEAVRESKSNRWLQTFNQLCMGITIVRPLTLHMHLSFRTCWWYHIHTRRPNITAVGCSVIGLQIHSVSVPRCQKCNCQEFYSVYFGYGICLISLRCDTWIKFQCCIVGDLIQALYRRDCTQTPYPKCTEQAFCQLHF